MIGRGLKHAVEPRDPAGRGPGPTRRGFLRLGALLGSLVAACRPKGALEHVLDPLGSPVSDYGERSSFEVAKRWLPGSVFGEASASFTPLRELEGIITPSALHFERHHAGIPEIDQAEHQLLVHGLVERPLVLKMEDLRRLPSVSRIYFLECSGNGLNEWTGSGAPDVQKSHGLVSCSEWTGVPLATVLELVGLRAEASWVVAEGADACKMSRSVPLSNALDDTLLAYGQNGEALRPGQGYPLRLLVPGCEGNVSIKWLRQLKIVDQPYMSREETSKYTDLLADGTARQFTLEMEAKSVITSPSGGQTISTAVPQPIRGFAWSGRGRIAKVEVSTNGGASWQQAALPGPRLEKALTRFELSWHWRGDERLLMSRAIDDTGYVQPTRAELVAVRGVHSHYHQNAIKPWRVTAEGEVLSVGA